MRLKSKVASTQNDPGAFETGKGSIRSFDKVEQQDGDKSSYNDLAHPDSGDASSP